MKIRSIVLLLSSSLFMLTLGFSQQSSNASTPPAGSAAQTSSSPDTADLVRQPLTDPKPANFWDGDDPNGLNLLLHPFARKAWIQRHLAPIRDRINELDEITSENATKIKDIDARSKQGLQLASEKTNLADQHATDAASRSQLAQTAATQASTHVANAQQMVGTLDQYKTGSQTELRFRPGQTTLSKQAKDALDQIATPLKDQRSYIFEIRGFAPGSGQTAIATSQKIADSVERYLVESHQIPVYRIFVVGMGNAPATSEQGTARHTKGERVEISVLKNDLVSSAQR